MQIEGSIRANLAAAVASARRLRGKAVHDDTVAYWHALLEHARGAGGEPQGEPFGQLMADLEIELARSQVA